MKVGKETISETFQKLENRLKNKDYYTAIFLTFLLEKLLRKKIEENMKYK